MRRGASDKARRSTETSDKARGSFDPLRPPSPDPVLDRCRHGKTAAEDCRVCDYGEPE